MLKFNSKASPPAPLLKERVARVEDESRERLNLYSLHSLKLKGKAKLLRTNKTEAEKTLWKRLRAGRLMGYKFRRQFPIGNYIVDFFCYEKMLAIELDGSHHAEDEFAEYDKVRTIHLEVRGIKVLRFWNSAIKYRIEDVLQTIVNNLEDCHTKE